MDAYSTIYRYIIQGEPSFIQISPLVMRDPIATRSTYREADNEGLRPECGVRHTRCRRQSGGDRKGWGLHELLGNLNFGRRSLILCSKIDLSRVISGDTDDTLEMDLPASPYGERLGI